MRRRCITRGRRSLVNTLDRMASGSLMFKECSIHCNLRYDCHSASLNEDEGTTSVLGMVDGGVGIECCTTTTSCCGCLGRQFGHDLPWSKCLPNTEANLFVLRLQFGQCPFLLSGRCICVGSFESNPKLSILLFIVGTVIVIQYC